VDGESTADRFDHDRLLEEQRRLAGLRPEPWRPGAAPLLAAGCFVAFNRGEEGPGRPGDRAWTGAALVREGGEVVATVAVPGETGAAYEPGLLAAREGALLLDALRRLPVRPDVVLVDATGRDHPRRAGLALHVGALLDVPSIGVTHRPLHATGAPPPDDDRDVGASTPVTLDGDVVAAWVRTRRGVRPVVAHAAWRTDVATAVDVVLRTTVAARTPEPLRVARTVARETRSHAG
jgi:deoxyribonuclease V